MCRQAVSGVTQVVDGVLEGQRLQAVLLAERWVRPPLRLRCALRLSLSGCCSDLVQHQLGGDRFGVGLVEGGRGVADGGLGVCPAEAGWGLVVWWQHCGAVRDLSVLQVQQRHTAAAGQQAVLLLLVRWAGVGGRVLLSWQGALTSSVSLCDVTPRRSQAASLAAAAGSDTYRVSSCSHVMCTDSHLTTDWLPVSGVLKDSL